MIRLLIFLFLFFNCSFAKEVFTKAKKVNNKIFIYLHNNSYHDITINYKAQYTNLLPLGDLPLIRSYPAKSKTKIFEFLITNDKFTYKGSYRWALGTTNAKHKNSYLYRLPYEIGTKQQVTQGYNGNFSHKGNSKYAIDFALKEGSKVYAARSGLVVKTKDDSKEGGSNKRYLDKANTIVIKHDDNTYAVYNHLLYKGIKVKEGTYVKRGDFLALSGNTGYSNGAHLHFIVYRLLNTKKRESFPLKFKTKRGILTNPKRGSFYQAVK